MTVFVPVRAFFRIRLTDPILAEGWRLDQPADALPDPAAHVWRPHEDGLFEASAQGAWAAPEDDPAPRAPLAARPADVALRAPASGVRLVGTGGDDVLRGTGKADTLDGRGGDDRLIGAGGDDLLKGGGGDDRLEGKAGKDRLVGGAGADTAIGGGGDDRLEGKGGKDRLVGGGGDDLALGGGGDDTLEGKAGKDALKGGGGDDRLVGGGGADTLDGGQGRDVLLGGGGGDELVGGGGADRLDGGEGDDLLLGGGGNDVILGGGGADVIVAGPGTDSVDGGAGIDVLRLSDDAGRYAIRADGDGLRIVHLGGGRDGVIFARNVEKASFGGAAAVTLASRPIGALSDVDAQDDEIVEFAAAGTAVGLTAQAADPDGDAVSYAIDDPRFAIDANGVVTVAPGADFDAAVEPFARVTVTAVSADGSEASKAFNISIGALSEALGAELANDNGVSASDGLTNDPTIRLDIAGAAQLTSLTASVDGGAPIDATGVVGADGAGLFDPGALADGAHSIVFTATFDDGAGGLTDDATVDFTLDASAPAVARILLAPSSDTGAVGDRATGYDVVSVIGEAERGATVSLGSIKALAGAGGAFALTGVALRDGENSFRVEAQDKAGNVTARILKITHTADPTPSPVIDWTRIALDAIADDAMIDTHASRVLAMLSVAMNDAIAAIDGGQPFLAAGDAQAGLSLTAAVASAAHGVLAYAFPAFKADLDAALDDYLSAEDAAAAAKGRALGEGVADTVVTLRDADGWDDYETYPGSEEIGHWRPTPPMYSVPVTPGFATLDPWAIGSGDRFRPDGPPALGSRAYADALAEVRGIGAIDSATRTADQTEAVRFWQDGAGTYTTPGHWTDIALDLAEERGLGAADAARLMAMLNVSVADAMIAAWDAKYHEGFWRPYDAIRNAADDGNPATVEDADWTPFLINPAHPEYVSGHSTASGAAAAVLAHVFGDDTAFSTQSSGLSGVTRSYGSFSEAAAENGMSRIWGGVHYSFSHEDGLELGAEVAEEVLRVFDLGADVTAPKILFDVADGLVAAGDVTVTGFAIDGLSGLESLSVSVDGGPAETLATDADGRFAHALTGLPDGALELTFEAVDAEGNVGVETLSLTLDSAAPTIAIDSLVEGGALTAGAALRGTADGTGSDLVSLTYAIDGGDARTITFNRTTGAYVKRLDISDLTAGGHAIAVTARDAAGNEATRTVNVTLAETAPFAVREVTPADGADDVGVTFRPSVTFTRAVDPDTLDNDSFYATDAKGAKLPATVLVSADGKTGWMFLDEPMPGAKSVTLHLDGARIAAAADGALLDGDGDGEEGGAYESAFVTVSRAPAPGTTLSGFVVGPGPDLKPMTTDDFSVGADGAPHTADDEFLVPIEGATVWILGAEAVKVVTDANGRFELTEVPAGTVKVAIDGRTATNPPDGYFYPEMVMDVEITPGQANTLMDSMGGAAQRLANQGRGEAYLPQVSEGILTDILDGAETEVTVDAAGAPNLTDAQRAAIRLTVQPGVAVDENGAPVTGGSIGISTVPPELVRDMLPEGIMQHTFDLTIQAPGSSAFTTPAQITLPNVFGAAPGTKLNILSFDHTTGRLVIEGTATVSEDGLTVTSDPGTGITKPGWHGLTPPGGNGCDGGPPLQPDEEDPSVEETTLDPVTLPLYFHDGEGGIRFSREWTAPSPLPETPPPSGGDDDCPEPAPDPAGKEQPWIKVDIRIEGPLADFAEKAGNLALVDQSFTLRAGTGAERGFAFSMKDFEEMFGPGGLKNVDGDKLYGSKIRITVREQDADGNQTVTNEEIFVSRFVDAADDDHVDGRWKFAQTVNDGAGESHRAVPLELIGVEPDLEISNGAHFYRAASLGEMWFDPTATGAALTDSLRVGFASAGGGDAGAIALEGKGAAPETYHFDVASYNAQLLEVVNNTGSKYGFVNATQKALIDTAAERAALLGQIKAYAQKLFDDAGLKGVSESASAAGANAISFKDGTAFLRRDAMGNITGATLGGAVAAFAEADIDFDKLIELYTNRNDYNKYELAYLAAEKMNNVIGGPIEFYIGNYFAFPSSSNSTNDLRYSLGKTSAHEVGHNIGLTHTVQGALVLIANGGDDVMAQGIFTTDSQSFDESLPAAKVNLHNSYTADELLKALAYYNEANTSRAGYITGINDSVGVVAGVDTGHSPYAEVIGPALDIRLDDGSVVFDAIDLGAASVDGPGGAASQATATFLNYGSEPLTLSGFGVSSAAFSIDAPAGETTLASGESLDVTVTFDPDAPGGAFGSLNFESNAPGVTTEIALAGQGRAQGPWMTVLFDEGNNLGGLELSDADLPRIAATIRNDGDETLVIDGISFSGDAGFAPVGLPDLGAAPVALEFGETFSFDISFDAAQAGIARGLLDISSNDVSGALAQPSVIGTGFVDLPFFDWGDDYVAVEVNGEYLRTVSGPDGAFEFFLPAETDYHIAVFDPQSGLIAHGYGTTPESGRGSDLASGLVFAASVAADSDFDGLADDIEKAIGSSVRRQDTNADGLSDFAAIKLGLNPLAGVEDPTGVIGTLALDGGVTDIEIVQDAPGFGGPIAVAATAAGLVVLDLTDPRAPIVALEAPMTPAPVEIAYDPTFGRLAAVDAAGGGAIYDLEDLAASGAAATPIVFAAAGVAPNIAVGDGVLHVGVSGAIVARDMATGEQLSSFDLPGAAVVRGLAREGDMLYALGSDGALRVLEIGFSGALVERGSVSTGYGDRDRALFVGGGVVHIPADNGFLGGYATVDATDPDAPTLASGPDDPALGGDAIALNGSGLGVAVGDPGGVFGVNAIDLVNVSDPAETGALVTRFTLDAAPQAVAIARGLAYVGDEAGGFHVVNYLARDVDGAAPTITIVSPVEDADPAAAGVQVVEGSTISFDAAVFDDVQVALVELLIDGAVVSSDVDYPFEWSVPAPLLSSLAPGDDAITAQLRATDTGGNAGLSELMTLNIIADTVAPELAASSVEDGDTLGRSARTFRFVFSEPIREEEIDATAIVLRDPNGAAVVPDEIIVNARGGEVILVMPELEIGAHSFEIDGARILDAAGNDMDAAVTTIDFTVDRFSNVWIGDADGSWTDPANWSAGRVPQDGDDLLLDVPQDVVVTAPSATGEVRLATLVAREEIDVKFGATLIVSGDAEIDRLVVNGGTVVFDGPARIGELVMNNGRIDGAGDISVDGAFEWRDGSLHGTGALTVEAGASMRIGDDPNPEDANHYYSRFVELSRDLHVSGEADMQRVYVTLGERLYDPVLAAYEDRPGRVIVDAGGVLNLDGGFADFYTNESFPNWVGSVFLDTFEAPASGIVNNGAINRTGGGEAALAGSVSGSGVYDSTDGDFVLSGVLNASDAGGLGRLIIDGGVLLMDAALDVAALELRNGSIVGDGDLTVTSRLDWTGGGMAGSGVTRLADGATGLIGRTFDPDTAYYDVRSVNLDRELEAAGALTVEQAYVYLGDRAYDQATAEYVLRDGVLRVAATGSLIVEGAQVAFDRGSSQAAGEIVNDGRIEKTGGGVADLAVSVSGGGPVLALDGVIRIISGEVFHLSDATGLSSIRVEGGRLVVEEAVSMEGLELLAGQVIVRGDGALSVTGSMTWRGGEIRGDGEVTIPLGATLDIGAVQPEEQGYWSTASLSLDATLKIAGAATIDHARVTLGGNGWDPVAGAYVGYPGEIDIQPGGVLETRGHDVRFDAVAAYGGMIVNEGTLRIADGLLRTATDMTGGGAFDLGAGVLEVTGGVFELTAGMSVSDITVSGGRLIVQDASTLESLTVKGGVVELAADLAVSGAFDWTSGTINGAGVLTLDAGSAARLGAPFDPETNGSFATLYLGAELAVNGVLDHDAALLRLGASSTEPGIVTVGATGDYRFNTWMSDVDRNVNVAQNAFVNNGTLTKTAMGVSAITSVTFESTGAITAIEGKLETPLGDFGVYVPPPDTPRPVDPGIVDPVMADGELTGGETLTLGAGADLTGLTVNGGTLVVDGAAEIADLTFLGGTITGDGDLTVTGDFHWEGGRMGGAGTFTLSEGASGWFGENWDENGRNQNDSLHLQKTLVLEGAAQLEQATLYFNGTAPAPGGGSIYEAGWILIGETGSLSLNGRYSDLRLYRGNVPGGVVNDGEVIVDEGGEAEFGVAYSGAGGVAIVDGVLELISGADFTLTAGTGIDEIVLNGGVLHVAEAASLDALTILNGTLDVDAALTVTGSLDWFRGVIEGVGGVVVADGATFEAGAHSDPRQSPTYTSMTLNSELDLLGDGVIEDGSIQLGSVEWNPVTSMYELIGGRFEVHSGARLDLVGPRSDFGGYGAPEGTLNHAGTSYDRASEFVNDGLVAKSGAGTATLAGEISGAGAFETAGGRIVLGNAAFATLDGGLSFDELNIDGGYVHVVAPDALDRLTMDNGTLRADAALEVAQDMRLSGGAVLGDGSVTVAAGATGLIGKVHDPERGYFEQSNVALGADLIVEGDVSLEQAQLTVTRQFYDYALGAYQTLAGVVDVSAGGALTLVGPTSRIVEGLTTDDVGLRVDGTLIRDGLGHSDIGVDTAGTGAMTALDGEFRFVQNGSLTVGDGLSVSEAVLDGGVLKIEGAAQLDRLTVLGGEVVGGSDLELSDTFVWSGGALLNDGVITVADGATAQLGVPPDPDASGSSIRNLRLAGELSIAGDGLIENARVQMGDIRFDPVLGENVSRPGALAVEPGGTLEFRGPLSDIQDYYSSLDNRLRNDGELIKSGGGTSSIDPGIDVTGTGLVTVIDGFFDGL